MKKEDIEELQKKFKNLNDLSRKYTNLGYKKSSNIIFYKPRNELEEKKIKEVNKKGLVIALSITILFLILFILSFFVKGKIFGIVIMGILTLTSLYLTIKSKINDELMIGKAAFKERIRVPNHSKRTYNYYVSVVDEDNKVIYTKILVSKKEFDLIEEGTTILISRATNRGYIFEK